MWLRLSANQTEIGMFLFRFEDLHSPTVVFVVTDFPTDPAANSCLVLRAVMCSLLSASSTVLAVDVVWLYTDLTLIAVAIGIAIFRRTRLADLAVCVLSCCPAVTRTAELVSLSRRQDNKMQRDVRKQTHRTAKFPAFAAVAVALMVRVVYFVVAHFHFRHHLSNVGLAKVRISPEHGRHLVDFVYGAIQRGQLLDAVGHNLRSASEGRINEQCELSSSLLLRVRNRSKDKRCFSSKKWLLHMLYQANWSSS